MLTCTITRRAALAVVFTLMAGGAAAQFRADPTFDLNGLKVDVASRVAEGASTTITVTVSAIVPAGTSTATTVTVEVNEVAHGTGDATSEPDDVILNPGTAPLSFPANTTSGDVTRQVSGTIPLQTIGDPDAEDETVVLEVRTSGGLSITDEPGKTLTIDDDEVQSYVLALAAGAAPREGAGAFDVQVRAVPAHVDETKI